MKKSNYIEFIIEGQEELSTKVKKCLSGINSPEIVMDLTSMNILDAAKVMVLTSVYHSGKYPDGRIKCKLANDEKCNFINPFITKNLELV